MNWNAIPGVACITSLFLPVTVIIYNRFYQHRSLAALLAYYVLVIFYLAISEGLIPLPESFRINYGILTNYLDVPLMLTTLLFFCPNKQKQSLVRMLILSYVFYEIVITAIHGYRASTIKYVMGPGLLLVLVYSFYLFLRQVKFTIIHGKNHGRTIMLASILFAYFCYALIYYFYYILRTPYKADTLLLYFISTFVSATVMAIGLHMMRRRIRELRSLKVTRRELKMFFSH
jgi:hypothetical protein